MMKLLPAKKKGTEWIAIPLEVSTLEKAFNIYCLTKIKFTINQDKNSKELQEED